ncbi:Protein ENHANCED DISEASE RESISTANCE 2 [Camellia lanceoleosa]|uniref:Protein ENHANCED DISEASE RESISTANCE 2 n=1 Tax=Camellia lanceoleosa TaxID=1840588 RepID=A0ACC0FI56_9ERIC|nr:Protein ENHANCED DISEASE RESISTANCE 2 [Camellia lanceoleosa]
MSKVVYEGWMVRYGRRKIGRSFIHMRYFVLETRLLAYYKRKPTDNVVPIKTLLIDGNCRVEDRGLKTHRGHMVYVLFVYNKKEKYHQITALIRKEKIESESLVANGIKYVSFEYKSGIDNGRKSSSSDRESQFSVPEDEEDDSHANFLWRTTTRNGPLESISDRRRIRLRFVKPNTNNQAFSGKHWRLLQCEVRVRIFEELMMLISLYRFPKSCSRAMRAVGVVEASCEEIFELVMSMDTTQFEWDCSFQYGSLVEEVDGHTVILYWFPVCVWPRDLCFVRYWLVLFRSREHQNCDPQPGFVRDHVESGGFNISPLKPQNGRPRTQVQHLMQIDLKGWGVGYISSFQQHCLLQMLNNVAGLREYFSETDERSAHPRIPVMINMASTPMSSKKSQKLHNHSTSLEQKNAANKNGMMMDKYSDEDDEFQIPDPECSMCLESDVKKTEKGFFSIVVNLQVPGSTHYSMIFYFVMKELVPGSLLQRFVDGDDEFRNSRLKIIPSVPNGSWIVRQSVGSTPCLLAKAVDCNYIRGPQYFEIDVDIGFSTVANGVLGLVIGVITTLVVDMAFLLQANTANELLEQLIGAVRVSHIELSSAIVPKLDLDPSD